MMRRLCFVWWRPRYVQELDYERELKHLVECHDAIMPRYAILATRCTVCMYTNLR